MPADHDGVGGVPDQPMNAEASTPPHPDTLASALQLSEVVRSVCRSSMVWSPADTHTRWNIGQYHSYMELYWKEYMTLGQRNEALRLYVIKRLERTS